MLKILYVKLKKALYGMIQAAMLCWINLSTALKRWGFEINPYNWCIASKMVNGKQITVVWRVDDLQISHADPKVVTELINKLDCRYGQDSRYNKTLLTIQHRKRHKHIGMILDYWTAGKVKIDIIEYTEKILLNVDNLFPGTAITPAANHLFEVNKKAKNLNDNESELFHHLVAQLLFLSKQPRPDLQMGLPS